MGVEVDEEDTVGENGENILYECVKLRKNTMVEVKKRRNRSLRVFGINPVV